jgi:uncharacterized protein YhhL (DUF1145 family)
MRADVKPPMVVKLTVFLFGVLAFLSWVAFGRSSGTTDTLAALLRTIPAHLAFIGVLSNTRFGRRVAVVVLLLLCLSGAVGILAAMSSFSSSPALAILAMLLVFGIFVWAGFYIFGTSTRAYYSCVCTAGVQKE